MTPGPCDDPSEPPSVPVGFDEKAARSLLKWYDRHARVLPWRVGPEEGKAGVSADPYRVWLSEIMLQQTTVRAVIPYFHRFLEKWPDVTALAEAPPDDVLSAWAGLGYYARARNLKACAEKVAADFDGRFPQTREELKSLPGIGDYTSAAISAIAFSKPEAAVDGNIERVIARSDLIEETGPKLKGLVAHVVSGIIPHDRPGDFTQAMMDLGATICTPKNPACSLCPVNENCQGYHTGRAAEFPKKAAKKAKPVRRGSIAVITDGDRVLLRKRPEKGLLAAMTEFPGSDWITGGEVPCLPDDILSLGKGWRMSGEGVRHTFTHFHLELNVWICGSPADRIPDPFWWSDIAAIGQEALPSVMRKVAEKSGITVHTA